MPSASSPKALQRKRLADKIDLLGFPTMAPCPQCIRSNSVCVVRQGYSRCSCCTRKNISCGGTFSDAEFNSLEHRKSELKRKSEEVRGRLTGLAHQVTALAQQILSEQRLHSSIERQLESITAKQSEMVDREARLLGELSEEPGGVQLALMSPDFSLDDPSWTAFLSGLEGGTDQQVPG